MKIILTPLERDVNKLIKKNRQLIRLLKEEHRLSKSERLYIKHNRDKIYYYEYAKGKEKAITSNVQRIRLLARLEIIRLYIAALEYNCILLERVTKSMKRLGNKREQEFFALLGIPIGLYTKEQFKWLSEPYQRNPYHLEHLQYTTTNGIKMRSKSEQAIANRLEANGIAYRAEPPLQLGSKTIYPDFAILLSDGEMVIWEHFGLMTDEGYRQNAQVKLDLYRNYGFVQHKNLICTYEEDIKSASDIDQIIERFLF